MRNFRFSIASLFVLVAGLFSQAGPQNRTWLHYEPAIVELSGKLIIRPEFGPPGYGETPKSDMKVKVPILLLAHAVNVQGDPSSELNSESVEGAKQIQLIFLTRITYHQFVGKQVLVKGTLFRGHTGHHYTDVLITVTDIKEKKNK